MLYRRLHSKLRDLALRRLPGPPGVLSEACRALDDSAIVIAHHAELVSGRSARIGGGMIVIDDQAAWSAWRKAADEYLSLRSAEFRLSAPARLHVERR